MMRRAVLTGLLTAMWVGVTLAFLRVLGPDWGLYVPATCLGTHCFCELPRTGALLLQPANSWSSFGFVLVGSWVMLGAAARPGRPLSGFAAMWLGFTAIVIGVGSAALHASLTLWGQFADVLGMYLLGAFILTWGLMRWRGLSVGVAIALYIGVAGGLIASLWLWPESRRWLFAVLLVAGIVVEWFGARPKRRGVAARYFLLGLAANLLAFAIWILDQQRIVCAPESLLQGHAVWHLLGAAAVALSYVYYRSETEPERGARR